jgi:hypothetical protein
MRILRCSLNIPSQCSPKKEEAFVTSTIEDQTSEGHVNEDTSQEPTLEDQAYVEDQELILEEISPSSSIQEKEDAASFISNSDFTSNEGSEVELDIETLHDDFQPLIMEISANV